MLRTRDLRIGDVVEFHSVFSSGSSFMIAGAGTGVVRGVVSSVSRGEQGKPACVFLSDVAAGRVVRVSVGWMERHAVRVVSPSPAELFCAFGFVLACVQLCRRHGEAFEVTEKKRITKWRAVVGGLISDAVAAESVAALLPEWDGDACDLVDAGGLL